MKSRTSLFNPTAFKKDVTRFAPAWVLYTVMLFMVLTVAMIDTDHEYYKADQLAQTLSFMAALNLCYGLLNAQLLFGDLFNARHCNALHAMPLRRECWFTTHVVSGLLFALVPNLLMTLVAMPMLGGGWQVALWWYLAVALEYLFFFGLAVLSALCVGNRFAMVLVYGILNFFSLIVYWFYSSIYQPLLYGVYVSEEPFLWFCPVWKMIENYEVIEVERRAVETSFRTDYFVKSVSLGEGWGYLAICAVLGAALLGVALLLYRRRKLESAGDFMAVKALEPVFLVLYTLCMAAGFQMFAELFGANENIFLALGLIIGFFTGRMLLMRTTKVFQPKGFLWFGILAVVFILSMVLTWLDPVGVTRYIPDADDVREVKVSAGYYPQYGNEPYMSDPEDIDTVLRIHQLVLDDEIHSTLEDDTDYYNSICFHYVLDNTTVSRSYQVACSSAAGQLAQELYTRAAYVLGTDDVEAFVKNISCMYYTNDVLSVSGELYNNYTNIEYFRGLTEAILADCAEGTMAQSPGYHPGEEVIAWIQFEMQLPDGSYNYVSVDVYETNRHIVDYLEEHPVPTAESYG